MPIGSGGQTQSDPGRAVRGPQTPLRRARPCCVDPSPVGDPPTAARIGETIRKSSPHRWGEAGRAGLRCVTNCRFGHPASVRGWRWRHGGTSPAAIGEGVETASCRTQSVLAATCGTTFATPRGSEPYLRHIAPLQRVSRQVLSACSPRCETVPALVVLSGIRSASKRHGGWDDR